jgi:glycosyltransferase involved in cell wall biosynthesis
VVKLPRKININFTLWYTSLAGGTRVIFEVANRLAARGHKVTITALSGDHSWFPLKVPVKYPKPPKWLEIIGFYIKPIKKRNIQYIDITKLSKLGISVDLIKPLAEIIPECDINVATYCLTAYAVYRRSIGKAFYYVQHYEPLFFDDPYYQLMAKETYYLPLIPLTVSRWLYKKMKGFNHKPFYVGNGVNHDVFYPRLIEKEKNTILSIFTGKKWKGEYEVLAALKKVAKYSKIKLIAVGEKCVIQKLFEKFYPLNFEVEYHFMPDDEKLAELYSKSQIYVSGSWYEGFCLPALEAMACGTPVVTTDSLGIRDYAVNKFNSLIVPPKDPKVLANTIINLLNDEDLAEKLRVNGLKTAKKFTWDKVVNRIEKAFIKALRKT